MSDAQALAEALNTSIRNIQSRLDRIELQVSPVGPHATTHEPGGSDAMAANAAAAIASLRSLGTGATQAAAGNDARFGTVSAHHLTHEVGGSDEITNLREKLPSYNVKDYGATGNGVTDDYTNIQAAVTAWQATGGTLIFPAGNYIINTGLLLTAVSGKRYIIQANGNAVLMPTMGTGQGFAFLGNSNCNLAIHGLAVAHSPAATTSQYSSHGIQIQPTTSGTSSFVGVLLQDVHVIGMPGIGINIVNCFTVDVINCYSTLNKVAGLGFEGGGNVLVAGGAYDSNISSDGGSDYGIAFGSSATYSACAGCTVYGAQTNLNGRKGIDAHHATDIKFIGNTVKGNGNSSASSPAGIYALGETSQKVVKDVIIAFNTIDMNGATAGAGYGIQVGVSDTPNESGSFIIMGNIIRNCNWHVSSGGILVNNASAGTAIAKVIIEGNTLETPSGTSAYAINADNNSINIRIIMILNNIIKYPSTNTTGAIRSPAADHHIVVGNVMDFGGTVTNGIVTASGPALVAHNMMFGTAPTNPLTIANTSTIHTNVVGTTTINDVLIRGALALGYKVVTGLSGVTIPIGTRSGALVQAFGYTFPGGAPIVLATMQQGLAVGEMPCGVTVHTVSATGCTIQLDCFANVAAARTPNVAWMAIGN